MASFRKVTGGWRAEVFVNGVRKSKTRLTKAEAKSWAAEMEVELGKLADGISVTHSLGDVFERYAREVSEFKKGAQWEIVRLRALGKDSVAGVKLLDLRREHFDSWVNRRMKVVRASSVNRELNLISHCLTQARRWRLMQHNPLDDLLRPKNPPPRDRRISGAEIEAIMIALGYSERVPVIKQQQRVAVAFLFAIETAMRAGEICGLTAADISLGDRTAKILQTKNGYPRSVPLSSEAIRLLGRLGPWPESGTVFVVRSGVLSTIFKKAIKMAGIDNLTFHDSRHEATTRLADVFDVLELARVTGHRDIKQLMTYYNKTASELAQKLI